MWIYEKKLEFPVNIRSKDLKMAQCLMAQYGGPSGELSAGLQYLTQRYTMPTGATKALLTDIGISDTKCSEDLGSLVPSGFEEGEGEGIHPCRNDSMPKMLLFLDKLCIFQKTKRRNPSKDSFEYMATEEPEFIVDIMLNIPDVS